MASSKRVSGDYRIISVDKDGGDNVLISTHTLTIDGNVNIIGSTSEVDVSQTTIVDPIVTLGKGNTGAITHLGIEVVKSPGQKAGLRWNSDLSRWELSSDNFVWNPIASSGSFSLFDDPAPTMSADLNTNNFAITSPNSEVTLNNSLVVPHRIAAPSAVVGATKIYAKSVGAGGSGLFVSVITPELSTVQDELVSRSKAIIYSIIF